jgi:hypothetical protein
MGQLTNFTEKKILDHVLKVASYSPPANVYVGLSSADPTADGSGWVDADYTGYARKQVTFDAAASRKVVQAALVSFDLCTDGDDTVSYFGIWDQLTGGNLMAYGALSTPKQVVAGNTPSVGDEEIQVSFNAGALFDDFAEAVLDWLFRAQALAQPTHVKIGLSTTTPADDGPNITEPVGNNYSQKEFDTWNGASGDPEEASNDGDIVMATPSGSWGLCTHSVVYLDTTPAFWGTIPAQTPADGDTVEWLDEQFTIGIQ